MVQPLEPLEGGEEESEARMFQYVNKSALASCETVLGMAGVIGNFIVIVGILADRKLRRSSRHFILLNICLVCLLEIGVVGAVSTYPAITNQPPIKLTNCFTVVLESMAFFSVSVVLLLLCTMCINEYLDLLLPHTTERKIRLCVAVELILCSWFGSAIIIVPIVVYGKVNPNKCDFILKSKYHALLGVLHYVPQAVLAFFLGTLLLLCAIVKRSRVSLTQQPNQFPIDIFMACLTGIILNLPFSLFYTAFNHCSPEQGTCMSMYRFWVVASRLSFLTFVVLPYVWLLGKPLRGSVHRVLCCCHKQQPSDSRNHYVSVSNDVDLTL